MRHGIKERYSKWEQLIYTATMKTIGRTTHKPSGGKRVSTEVERLRKERTTCRKEFEMEKDFASKGVKKQMYIRKQKKLASKIEEEE